MNLIIIFLTFKSLYQTSDSSSSNMPTEEELVLVPTEDELNLVTSALAWKNLKKSTYYYDLTANDKHFYTYFVEHSTFDSKYKRGGIILNSLYVCLIEQLYKKYSKAANHYKNNLINHQDKLNGLKNVWKSIIMLKPLIKHMINALKFFNLEKTAVLDNLENLKKSISEIKINNELSEAEIDEKFEQILKVVTFEDSLKELKYKHNGEYYRERIIIDFINSLCGVREDDIQEEKFINPALFYINKNIERGIKVFYFNFGFRYIMFKQENLGNLELKFFPCSKSGVKK